MTVHWPIRKTISHQSGTFLPPPKINILSQANFCAVQLRQLQQFAVCILCFIQRSLFFVLFASRENHLDTRSLSYCYSETFAVAVAVASILFITSSAHHTSQGGGHTPWRLLWTRYSMHFIVKPFKWAKSMSLTPLFFFFRLIDQRDWGRGSFVQPTLYNNDSNKPFGQTHNIFQMAKTQKNKATSFHLGIYTQPEFLPTSIIMQICCN